MCTAGSLSAAARSASLLADEPRVDGGADVVGVGGAGGPVHAEDVDILLKLITCNNALA